MSGLIRNIGKYREKPKDIIDGMHILKRTANRFPLFYERIQKNIRYERIARLAQAFRFLYTLMIILIEFLECL
jgi:hypothetical protein